MAVSNADGALVNARIVFWGIDGSGKTTNLEAIHDKLRPDHRGEMRDVPTPFDPTITYEELPIELGEIAGVRTQIRLVAVPGGPEQHHTRKQILDEVDGIVLVVDSQPHRVAENLASLEELRGLLRDYGRSLEEIPLVVQYNKRDLADSYQLEELHRKLGLDGRAVFETVATERTRVLQTLSTISKLVIRSLRGSEEAEPHRAARTQSPADTTAGDLRSARTDPPTVLEHPALETHTDGDGSNADVGAETLSPLERMEAAILEDGDAPDFDDLDSTVQRAEQLLDTHWEQPAEETAKPEPIRMGADLSIVSVGEAEQMGRRAIRVPLVLGDLNGNTASLTLTIQLDPLMDED